MSALAHQLRRLAEQAGSKPCLPPAAAAGEIQRAALRRLLGLRDRHHPSGGMAVNKQFDLQLDRRIEGDEVAPGLYFREQHGPWPVLPAQAIDAMPSTFADAIGIQPSQLLFFDTETTGLAGGSGTRAFMIGAGDWHAGGFRIRQLTITTLGAEASMLAEFARWLRPEHVLCSYNGRSYDAPLLATRYRLARINNPLQYKAHLDLLYPTRRRFRGCFENCRMATIERHALGIVREGDLPGAEAPRAWRSYLAGGSARDLRRVGEHNAQDLRSLAALWGCLAA
ncbi:MAG: ribonuclease H-like domain-containing protein [Pseudomarimonas sp.]